MRLKMLGLVGALVFAVPVAAVAAPASGLTAQTTAPAAVTQALGTNNAAVDAAGPTAKLEKVWWRGGWRGGGWRGGWRGGWGWRGYGWRGGWGWRRPWGYGWGWRRRWWY